MKRLECIRPTQPNIRNMMAADFSNLKIGLNDAGLGKVIMAHFGTFLPLFVMN